MTTFADSGRAITDLFTKDFPITKTLEVSFLPHPEHLAVTLKGIFAGDAYQGYIIPTFKYRPWGVELRTEISSLDRYYKADLTVADVLTPGLKGEVGFVNGKKGEMSLGAIYRNAKFGGVTAKLGFPLGSAAAKYLSASLQVENEDTNGFGIGGAIKLFSGDELAVNDWKALVSYNKSNFNGFIGVEQKSDEVVKIVKEDSGIESTIISPTSDLCVVGGLMKIYENNKIFAINGNYNTTRDVSNIEFLFQKTFENRSFFKIKAGIDGLISTAREFPVSNGSIILGANADLHSKTGSLTLNVSTFF